MLAKCDLFKECKAGSTQGNETLKYTKTVGSGQGMSLIQYKQRKMTKFNLVSIFIKKRQSKNYKYNGISSKANSSIE